MLPDWEIHGLMPRNSLFFGGLVREFAVQACQQGPLRCIHQGLPMAGFWKDGMSCRIPDFQESGRRVA